MDISARTEPRRAAEVIGETSAVSWGAITAGAFAIAALALALLLLGAGLGLVTASPWANAGVSATTLGIAATIWLVFIHILSSGLGGFIAGRLRTKWSNIVRDEAYFRDTAHGFVAWAVSVIMGVALLSFLASSVISGSAQVGTQAVATLGGAATTAASQAAGQALSDVADPVDYFADMLLRSDRDTQASDDAAVRAEIGRILVTGAASGDVAAPDQAYLARVVASRTGLSQSEAEDRVSEIVTRAKEMTAKAEATARSAADEARKAGAYLALWTFIAMLCGAFSASYAATLGGRIRDA